MGRLRAELKKIENKTHRHIAFSKRKNGLLKKAFEISTICDPEINGFEEILKHYIHHIIEEHGRVSLIIDKQQLCGCLFNRTIKRLNNHKSLEMLLSQMTLEDVYNHWALTSGIRTSNGSSVDDLLKEINVVQDEIDELEEQIRCFTRSPKSLKTLSDAEIHQELWEGTLKRVQVHKLVLIAKNGIELPAASDHDQIDASASASGIMIGNSSHNLDRPPPPPAQAQAQSQIDFTVPLMDASGGSNSGSQPFSISNQPHYDAAEIQQPSPKLLHHVYGYPLPSCPPQNNGQNTNVYMPQPQNQFGQFTTGNLPSGVNTTDQLGDEEEAGSSATATGLFVTSPQYYNSSNPFPF